jgi:transposase
MSKRRFSREFKLSAVKLVNEQGYSIPEAAKSLGVAPANVRGWVEKFSSEAGLAPSGEGALSRRQGTLPHGTCLANVAIQISAGVSA